MNVTKIFNEYDYIINTNTAIDYYYIHKAMILNLFITTQPDVWHVMFPKSSTTKISITPNEFKVFTDLISHIKIVLPTDINMMFYG